MNNTRGFYKTLSKEDLEKNKVKKEILDTRFHLEWNDDSSYTIISPDEDSKKTYTRHIDKVIGVLSLSSEVNKGKFISIGLDNTIQLSMNHGAQIASLEHFQNRIIGVKEFNDGSLAVVTEDGKLTFCDCLKPNYKREINANTSNLDDICFLEQQSTVFIKSKNDTTIWTFDGQLVLTLKDLNSRLRKAYLLSSGNWLIWTDLGETSLWSHKGIRLNIFDFKFENNNDFVELEDHNLLIRKSNSTIGLFEADGNFLCEHSRSNDIDQHFEKLADNWQQFNKTVKANPDIHHFTHYGSFLGPLGCSFIPADKIDKNWLVTSNSEKQKFWNFFYRPDTWKLRTVLKDLVNASRASEKSLCEDCDNTKTTIKTSLKIATTRKVITWFSFALVLAAVMFGVYGMLNPGVLKAWSTVLGVPARFVEGNAVLYAFSPTGLMIFAWLFFSRKLASAKNKIKICQNDLKIKEVVLTCHSQIIRHIKEYRRKLINQIPMLKTDQEDVFNGEFIHKYLNDMLNNKLKKIALHECGLDEDDIKFSGREPIILTSWSYIQDKEKLQIIKDKCDQDNLLAIRTISDGALITAVQFIQYIFLTNDKVDVFTMHYDFIEDKVMGKEANAFFYKDVTNISKRTVDRLSLFDKIEATEIILSVSSGEKISLTILNNESISSINQKVKDNETTSPDMEIKRLEKEKLEVLNDINMSEEDKQDELQVIDLRMKDAQSNIQQATIADIGNIAEMAITNIRSQLKQHKKEIA